MARKDSFVDATTAKAVGGAECLKTFMTKLMNSIRDREHQICRIESKENLEDAIAGLLCEILEATKHARLNAPKNVSEVELATMALRRLRKPAPQSRGRVGILHELKRRLFGSKYGDSEVLVEKVDCSNEHGMMRVSHTEMEGLVDIPKSLQVHLKNKFEEVVDRVLSDVLKTPKTRHRREIVTTYITDRALSYCEYGVVSEHVLDALEETTLTKIQEAQICPAKLTCEQFQYALVATKQTDVAIVKAAFRERIVELKNIEKELRCRGVVEWEVQTLDGMLNQNVSD